MRRKAARLLGSVRTLSTARYPTTPCGAHPLINVEPLLSTPPTAEVRTAVASQIGAALREVGYFYADGVSVLPPEYISQIYSYSRRAHTLSTEVKWRYRQRGGLGSYSGPDVGEPELDYEASTVMATARGWDYSRSRFSLGSGDSVPPAERYPPAEVLAPAFAVTLDELYERQDTLGRALLGGIEGALSLPAGTLLDMFHGGDFGTIRLLHYPATVSAARSGGEGSGELSGEGSEALGHGIGAHTDFEVFTLMYQDAPGLQFMRREPGGTGHAKGWVDAPVLAGECVVCVGDCLERLTNGELLATPHRVVLQPLSAARSSIVRFNAFRPDAIVRPLERFVSASRPAAYSPVRMGTHMETTMRRLAEGAGSWDPRAQQSLSAKHDYGPMLDDGPGRPPS